MEYMLANINASPEHIWLPLQEEPAMWYERFDAYRMLPASSRSINALYRIFVEEGVVSGAKATQEWYRRASEWHWQERARAWDAYIMERVHARYEEFLLEAHEERMRMVSGLLPEVHLLLLNALRNLSVDEGKKNLFSLYRMFMGLLEEYRIELGLAGLGRKDVDAPRLEEELDALIAKAYGDESD